tara:strand:+ start:1697 stop:2152 length:456 start_codon:yes stop_codon:yes gene_type:complete
MVRRSLHPGGIRRVVEKVLGAAPVEAEPELEEDFFHPEAAAVDNNPFPEELMTEAEAEEVVEAVVAEVSAAEPEPTYNSMTVNQLQDLLRERGLTVSGVKAELVARLEADDAGPSEESEAPAETAEAPSEEVVSSDEVPQEGDVSESGEQQ